MKFEDVKVGQFLAYSNWKGTYEVVFKNDEVFLVKKPDGRYMKWEKIIMTANWSLVKTKKKVYCSVWTQPLGSTWSISYPDLATYRRLVDGYRKNGYTLIKEWELEYEVSDEPNSQSR